MDIGRLGPLDAAPSLNSLALIPSTALSEFDSVRQQEQYPCARFLEGPAVYILQAR